MWLFLEYLNQVYRNILGIQLDIIPVDISGTEQKLFAKLAIQKYVF